MILPLFLLTFLSNLALAKRSKSEILSYNSEKVQQFIQTLGPYETERINKLVIKMNSIYPKYKKYKKYQKYLKAKKYENHALTSFRNRYERSKKYKRFSSFTELPIMTQLLPDSSNTKAAVFILVQGLPNAPGKEGFLEWFKSIHALAFAGNPTFFHLLITPLSMAQNASNLEYTIEKIRKKFPERKIEIIGYSAGGAVAMKYLSNTLAKNRPGINVTTVASPIFGYGAPKFIRHFSKAINIEFAIGLNHKFSNLVNQCTHYTTLICNNDIHACERAGVHPQLGAIESMGEAMPCGKENLYIFPEDTHYSILTRAVKDRIINAN